MFKAKARDADGMAAAAWHELVSGLASARGTASGTVEEARGRMSGVGSEARRRASNAMDAISGKPQPSHWQYVVSAAVGGAVLGYAVAQVMRRHPMDEAADAVREQAGKAKSAVETRLRA
jgi:hypothetical protein